MSQAYLNTPTLIAPALASFTHRHLKLDADRQAHELHRLASLRSGGFLLEELAELSKLLVLASRAPHVAQLVPALARVVRLCGSAQPRADRSSESSRQPEPITAILDALGALLASPHDAVFAAAGESLEAIARRLGEAPPQASPPQPLVGIRALEASTAPLAALDCLLGTCVEFRPIGQFPQHRCHCTVFRVFHHPDKPASLTQTERGHGLIITRASLVVSTP